MKFFRNIKNYFKIKKTVKSLKWQINQTKYKRGGVCAGNEEVYKDFYEHSKELYNIHSDTGVLIIHLEMMIGINNDEKSFCLSPKLIIDFEVSCCYKLKMISKLDDKSNGVRYALFKGSNILLSGDGDFKNCINEIEIFLKEKKDK